MHHAPPTDDAFNDLARSVMDLRAVLHDALQEAKAAGVPHWRIRQELRLSLQTVARRPGEGGST